MPEKFVNVDGRSLWSESVGSDGADTILLVAGANAPALMWPNDFVALLVSKGYRVIRYDHRDTGRSTFIEFDDAPYTVEDLSSDAVSILDAWGVDKAHVVGLSIGATLGQVLALDHPDRLHSLTLMCGAALDVDFVGNIGRAFSGESSPDGLPLPDREVLEALSARATPSKSMEEELDRRVKEWALLSGEKLELDASDFRLREQRCIDHAGTWAQPGNHAMATPVPLSRGVELRKVSVPALVIQGSEDPLNPPPHGKHIADLLPNGHLVEMDGLGHCLPKALFPRIADEIAHHAEQSHAADARTSRA
ncbi:alpha/beta hydrolase [Ketobacter sp. MCCC 1A13808]|uniref:alpha/beta fold hydrolase n=1 Tax=Ketobacter sp. MCCC 1A13808 TaxID=2602738 RepID=UPI0012EB55E1|nr:alpha/beta hydrolase [Ketobacter sp. MCCC 1A13808]MVF11316.1 alpha/beta hydrolase [Ketobacter sp. MCCC 1A13808]